MSGRPMKPPRTVRPSSSARHWSWRRGVSILGVFTFGMIWTLGSSFITSAVLLDAGGRVAEFLGWILVYIPLLATALGTFAVGTRSGRRRSLLWRALAAGAAVWCLLLLVLVGTANSSG